MEVVMAIYTIETIVTLKMEVVKVIVMLTL